ncbi:MAG: response regulator [Deltaproteobacteria bacterium]
MKVLIVEDDFVSAKLLDTILSSFASCDIATNGIIAVEMIEKSFEEEILYDLICLDIMLPELDGHEVLKRLREIEEELNNLQPIKVIMITALGDSENIKKSFGGKAEAYLVKPIFREKLLETIKMLELID